MVLDPKSQTLFIFAGQRDERYLSDMYAFHIPSNTVTELYSNFTSAGGPDPCFTQRAVIDPDKQEIYMCASAISLFLSSLADGASSVCGLTRAKATGTPVLEAQAPYWIYHYDRPELPGRWSKIMPDKDAEPISPQPRYAHQVVYDSRSGSLYMHGGNAGLGDDEHDSESRPSSSSSGGEPGSGHATKDADSERRLDDFWHLDIVRCVLLTIPVLRMRSRN